MSGPAATVPCPACEGRTRAPGAPGCEVCGDTGEATDEAVARLAGRSDPFCTCERSSGVVIEEEPGGVWRCLDCGMAAKPGPHNGPGLQGPAVQPPLLRPNRRVACVRPIGEG